MRVLVLDGDPISARLIGRVLLRERFVVDAAESAAEGLARARGTRYDGLALGMALGDRSGLDVLVELRREQPELPVIIVAGGRDEATIVRALDSGADDYVVKPIRPGEFAARVRALLRRRARPLNSELLCAGGVALNRLTRAVTVNGHATNLSPREFALLEVLLQRQNEIVTRGDLLQRVWATEFDPMTNVVAVQVGRLRRKLEAAGAHVEILSRRGRGILLTSERALT